MTRVTITAPDALAEAVALIAAARGWSVSQTWRHLATTGTTARAELSRVAMSAHLMATRERAGVLSDLLAAS